MTTDLPPLRRPFDPRVIKWRPGTKTKDGTKALALAYVDARDVMERLDEAFGQVWSCDFTTIDPKAGAIECCITVYNSDGGRVTRCDVGYPNKASDIEDATKEPLKAAYSDAFKRAAVHWGVGRDLYDTPQFWLPLNEWERFDAVPVHNGTEWVDPTRAATRVVNSLNAASNPVAADKPDERKASQGLRTKLLARCTSLGLTEPQVKALYMTVIDPKIRSSKDLTVTQVETLLGWLDDPEHVENAKTVEAVDVEAKP